MNIKILGSGCAKCKALADAVQKAAQEINLKADIEKIEDINQIISYGVISTPALVINGKVIKTQSFINKEEIKQLLKQNIGH